MSDTEPKRPLLRVVRGTPDDAELVALTAVVLGMASATRPEPTTPPRSVWASRASALRRTLPHGQGAWRASGLSR
jgi:hypothetical protein